MIASLTQAERLRCIFGPSPECSGEGGRLRIAEQVRDLADRIAASRSDSGSASLIGLAMMSENR